MLGNRCDSQLIRISLDEANLATGYFYLRKIGVPTTINYSGFTTLISQGDGGEAAHGYATCILTWVNPDSKTVYRIKKFVDNGLAGTRLLYLTVPYNDGSVLGRTFIDVRGVPRPIVVEEQENFGSPGIAYTEMTLFLNNVEIVNNPAVY